MSTKAAYSILKEEQGEGNVLRQRVIHAERAPIPERESARGSYAMPVAEPLLLLGRLLHLVFLTAGRPSRSQFTEAAGS